MDVERACANNTSELPETPGVAAIFAKFEAGYTARTGQELRRITPGARGLRGVNRRGWGCWRLWLLGSGTLRAGWEASSA